MMTTNGKENPMKVYCQKFQDIVFGNMEKFFNKLGYKVAKHPFIAILISVSIAGLLMVGFVRWRNETDASELWVPSNSEWYQNYKWLSETFPSKTRYQQYMLVSENGDNVLTKINMLKLAGISKAISNIR